MVVVGRQRKRSSLGRGFGPETPGPAPAPGTIIALTTASSLPAHGPAHAHPPARTFAARELVLAGPSRAATARAPSYATSCPRRGTANARSSHARPRSRTPFRRHHYATILAARHCQPTHPVPPFLCPLSRSVTAKGG